VNEHPGALLGPAEIRDLAGRLGIRPTKALGQNFVIDGGTVRKIVRQAGIAPGERVVEIGPGLGSLTLGLLEAGADVTAVEIDPVLARLLPETVAAHVPGLTRPDGTVDVAALDRRLTVVGADALDVTELPGPPPTALVANLPYNVSVPVILHLLATVPSLQTALVMVQAEVGQRLAAPPGSKVYGSPSAKAAWYGTWSTAGTVSRQVFWPIPNVDSILVAFSRRAAWPALAGDWPAVVATVRAAFAYRRKTVANSLTLAGWRDDRHAVGAACAAAGVDAGARAEALEPEVFLRLARAAA